MSTIDTNLDPREHPQQDVYGVIGNPVAHSLSPLIHAQFAIQAQQNVYYGKLFSETDAFEKTIETFFQHGGKGLNVTVPFKSRAFDLCHHLSERATAAGVVNILWQEDGKYYGDNSDGVGLVRDIENHPISIKGQRILVIGAGGAVQGVILPLLQKQPMQIVIANRTQEKAQKIVERFLPQAKAAKISLEAIALKDIEQLQQSFSIIINGTSSGLEGASPLTEEQAQHLAQTTKQANEGLGYDMVYGKPTAFMQQMSRVNYHVKDGLGMLVEQAAEAFEVWRHLENQNRLNTASVLEMIRKR